jgi:hypothetical protein
MRQITCQVVREDEAVRFYTILAAGPSEAFCLSASDSIFLAYRSKRATTEIVISFFKGYTKMLTEAQSQAVEAAILIAIYDGKRSVNFTTDLDEVISEATALTRSDQVYATPSLHDMDSRASFQW